MPLPAWKKVQLGLARGHLSGRCSAFTAADWVTMPRMCGNAPQCSSLLEAPAPFRFLHLHSTL
jgi:hypothetical protein